MSQTRQQRQNEYQKEVRSKLAEVRPSIQDIDQRLKTADYDHAGTLDETTLRQLAAFFLHGE
ncbi:hypothetical protein [Brenneria corticis]|uniref:Uncharacterized protein n=1 Tax=Brenneria corticis TaxID=2173106 RepID=A0A2U1U7R7_9GAMM|nr:hypothetical protein [Brenneria sp. CFCC 11842]PWC17682.1 hypothetical protein DDT56_05335 [Brenneria sp. CFCC 11842]